MNQIDYKAQIAEAVVEFDMDNIERMTHEALEAGVPATELVLDGLSVGMGVVGERYSSGEYFLPELMMCAETMKLSIAVLDPHIKRDPASQTAGRVLIGTVSGDLHDIGKNIVISMLQGAGFEVQDLGVDIPTPDFVEHVKNAKPDILGMSALLLTTQYAMGDVIKALQEAGIRDQVKVLVGGCPITPEFAEQIGADGYAPDALEAVKIARALITG